MQDILNAGLSLLPSSMGTPDRIDALVTVAGGAAMLGWLLYALSCTPS